MPHVDCTCTLNKKQKNVPCTLFVLSLWVVSGRGSMGRCFLLGKRATVMLMPFAWMVGSRVGGVGRTVRVHARVSDPGTGFVLTVASAQPALGYICLASLVPAQHDVTCTLHWHDVCGCFCKWPGWVYSGFSTTAMILLWSVLQTRGGWVVGEHSCVSDAWFASAAVMAQQQWPPVVLPPCTTCLL